VEATTRPSGIGSAHIFLGAAGCAMACMLMLAPLGLQLPASLAAYADAASALSSIAAAPNDSDHWQRLGRMLHGKGRLEASRLALAKAAELNGSDAEVRVALANVLRSTGRFDDSALALMEAERISGKRDQSLCYYRAPTSEAALSPLPTLGEDGVACSEPECPAECPTGEVRVTRMASVEECEWVIGTAEAFNAARGGWGNPPPRYAPAGTVADNVRAPHMLVADSPELLGWLNRKLETVVWPTLSRQFGEAVARDAWLYDAFLLKFDGHPGRRGLGLHVDDDGLGVSINLLLSSTDDFEGGGTLFTPVCDGAGAGGGGGADFVVRPQQGELVSHHGGLRHASVPTTGGTRYILVAFLRSPSLLVEPPAYVEGSYCYASQAAAAGWLAQAAASSSR